MEKETILAYLKNHKDEFAQKYHISNLTLFGSFHEMKTIIRAILI